eukprot:jgi/Tetstr1/437929/TSEL_026559.t1
MSEQRGGGDWTPTPAGQRGDGDGSSPAPGALSAPGGAGAGVMSPIAPERDDAGGLAAFSELSSLTQTPVSSYTATPQ